MGCAGNGEIRTPNLDRIAVTGIRCENFFCASPVCSPARASILTGRIPSQHGIHDWLRVGNYVSPNSAAEDQSAVEYLRGVRGYTDTLAENGYVCGLSGKWHLGDSARPQKGFTFWHVFPWGGGNYHNADILRNGVLENDQRYLTDVITEGGLQFLDSQAAVDAPFYLSVHYTAPHSPWEHGQHPEELTSLYAGLDFATCPNIAKHPWQINSAPRGEGDRRIELLTGYYAAVSGVDRGVGQLLEKLEQMGILSNTLVIFTSDNGMNMGHHGIWGKGNGTFPLNMYDSSVKVPMLISRPGHVAQGVVETRLLSHYDLMPTLLEYVGLDGAATADLPGRSFAPLLRGQVAVERDHVVVCDEYGPVRMIRECEWKYIHRYPYGPHELYDLVNDPGEELNLVNDTSQEARLTDMRYKLATWFARFVHPAMDGSKEPVSGKGQIDRAGLVGDGRTAFADDWWYIDASGNRRDDFIAHRQTRYFTGKE